MSEQTKEQDLQRVAELLKTQDATAEARCKASPPAGCSEVQ